MNRRGGERDAEVVGVKVVTTRVETSWLVKMLLLVMRLFYY